MLGATVRVSVSSRRDIDSTPGQRYIPHGNIHQNKRPDGLYSSAETLQKFANKIIWGGLIYKTVWENKYTSLLIKL